MLLGSTELGAVHAGSAGTSSCSRASSLRVRRTVRSGRSRSRHTPCGTAAHPDTSARTGQSGAIKEWDPRRYGRPGRSHRAAVPQGHSGPGDPTLHQAEGTDVLRADPGAEVLLVGLGPPASACLAAGQALARRGIGTTGVDPRWAAPLGPHLSNLAASHRLTVTVEDNVETGGFGARFAHQVIGSGLGGRLRTLSLPQHRRAAFSAGRITRCRATLACACAGTTPWQAGHPDPCA